MLKQYKDLWLVGVLMFLVENRCIVFCCFFLRWNSGGVVIKEGVFFVGVLI